MEQLVVEYLEKASGPQTTSELISGLAEGHSVSEVEESLKNLIKKKEIVSKFVRCPQKEEEKKEEVTRAPALGHEQCTLYWRVSRDDSSSFATPAKRSGGLLSTPRSGIGPPSKRSRLPFKSPAKIDDGKQQAAMQTPSTSAAPQTPCSARSTDKNSPDKLTGDVTKLKSRLEDVEREIADLTSSGCHAEELQAHIDALHEYNEIKDAGQLLLGKIAELEGTTTTSLYERFGLDLDN